eukprot:g481.t1
MIRRGLSDGFDLPSLDLLTVNMPEFREIQRERAKESQIHGFCNPQMIQRERSFDTFESMREDNDSNSDHDIHFSQEGIADVLHEHESWTDDDDGEFDTTSAYSTPKFRAESPPTWLDDEDEREEGIEIPELILSAGTPSVVTSTPMQAPSQHALSVVAPTPMQAPSNKRVRGESSLAGPSKRQKVTPQTHYNPDQKDATKAELVPFLRWMLDGEGLEGKSNAASLKARYMQRNGLTEEEWNEKAKLFLERLGEKVDATQLRASDAEVKKMKDIDRVKGREYVYLRIPMAGEPGGTKSTETPTFGGGYIRKLSIREAAWIRDIIRPFADAMKEYVGELGKSWVSTPRRASAQLR